jgi:pilus assembly protein CpaB
MNRNRMLIGAVVAIVIGLLASRYVYKQVQRAGTLKPMQTTQIVVAAERMALGARLQPHQLRLVSWPQDDPLPGSFTRIEDCTNRALITSLIENEPVLEGNLAPKEAGAGLPAVIPEGMRALSVRVDDVVGVAGFVVPGTMVDVLATGDMGGTSSGGNDSVTRTILEDVRVLAAGQKIEQDKDGKPQTVSVVTLLVDPGQADKLTMASTEARIHLALRNTIDTKQVNSPPVFRSALFGGTPPRTTAEPKVPNRRRMTKPPSISPPPPPYTVEVIKGEKRETHTFPAQ